MLLPLLIQVAPVPNAPPPASPAEALERSAGEETGAAAAQGWARAGLAWLEAGEGERARAAVDRALAANPSRVAQGELRLLGARADALTGDLAAARADLDLAIAALPGDTVPLLLSASLARRTGDLGRASRDLEAAWDLAPDDPLVLLESGRLARAAGEPEQASVAWRRVLAGAGDEAAKAEARQGLRALGLKVD